MNHPGQFFPIVQLYIHPLHSLVAEVSPLAVEHTPNFREGKVGRTAATS